MTTKPKTRPAPWTTMPGAKLAKKRKPKRIRPVSTKMKEWLGVYRRLKLHYMNWHPLCEKCLADTPIGQRMSYRVAKATDLHHKRGRGKFLCDVGTFAALCRKCHNWCHNHVAEAMQRGWIVSRLKKEAK